MHLIKIEDFGPGIFQHIASVWELDVSTGPIAMRPCCDAITCDDEMEYCKLTLTRPGADSFVYESNWYSGDVPPDEITAAWALRNAAEIVAVSEERNLADAFEQFCFNPAGHKPHLFGRHLISFAKAAEALEYFVFPGQISSELH